MRFYWFWNQKKTGTPRNREHCVYSQFVHLMLGEKVLETVRSLTYLQRMVSLCRYLWKTRLFSILLLILFTVKLMLCLLWLVVAHFILEFRHRWRLVRPRLPRPWNVLTVSQILSLLSRVSGCRPRFYRTKKLSCLHFVHGKNFALDLWATANLTASLKVEDYLSTLANNVKTSVTLDCDQTRQCYKALTLSLDEIMWATNSYIVLSNAQPCSIVVTICKNLTSTNVNLCGRGKRGKRREKQEGKIENLPPFFPSNACHIGSAMLTFSPN